jgi:HAD superfamily hydrolase (TIGR01458 family)
MKIRSVLLDLDGVLYVGSQAIPGAQSAFRKLKSAPLKLAGVTNTTTRSKAELISKLQQLGFDFSYDQIFTPAALAVERIGRQSAALFVHPRLRPDFAGVRLNETDPDFVVMGDMGRGYDAETLQRIFTLIMNGADILALHKNRFWQKEDGLHIDLGPFVAAMEYATGKRAEILGKPSRDFFHLICKMLDTRPEECLMVGDDIESDIHGAIRAGLRTALVKTGKYRKEFAERSGITPDVVLNSIRELPAWMGLASAMGVRL